MSEPVKSAKRLLSSVLAFIRSRNSMDNSPSHNPNPTDHLNIVPELSTSIDHPDAAAIGADIVASDTLQLPDTLAPLDSFLERKKSLLENSASSAQREPKQPTARIPTPQENQQAKKELATISDYIAAEVSLETIGYFVPSSKRIKDIDTKEEVLDEIANSDGTKTQVKVQFIYSRKYGIPNTTDLDYYRAFLKILDEVVETLGHIPEPLEISTEKLVRYAGKRWRAGQDARSTSTGKKTARPSTLKEVHEFIEINRYTGIQGNLYNAQSGEYAKVGEEPLFRKFVLRGEKMDDGRIADTNYVWLASWFRTNYEHHYLRTIDYAFHRRLRKPIAKALYPLLATGWYASGGYPFEKRYSAICKRFLLQEHSQASVIKRQLGPAFQELQGTDDKIKYAKSKRPRDLQREQFIEKWELRRSADGKDWILKFFPGTKYFKDLAAAKDRQKLAKRIPKALTSGIKKRSVSANSPNDLAYFLEEMGRILPISSVSDEAEQKKVTALCRKWLKFYPYYGVIDQALSEYKHDTEDLPMANQVETPLAYFQRILHRIAHTQGHAWIKPAPHTCEGCAQYSKVS